MATQAVWTESARVGVSTQLLQLPHLTSKHVASLTGRKWKITTVAQFAQVSQEKRNEFYSEEGLLGDQSRDIENVLKQMPTDMVVKMKYGVDEEDEKLGITAGSVVTIEAKIERPSTTANQKNKEDPVDVHAPFFPGEKTEVWWAMVGDERTNRLFNLKKVTSVRDQTEIKLPFMAPPKPGVYQFTFYLMCDSYVGFDFKQTVKLNVQKEVIPQIKKEEEEDFDEDEEDLSEEEEVEEAEGDEEEEEDEDK